CPREELAEHVLAEGSGPEPRGQARGMKHRNRPSSSPNAVRDGVVRREHRAEQPEEGERREHDRAGERETSGDEESELVGYPTVLASKPLAERDGAGAHHAPPPLPETVGSRYSYRLSAKRFITMTASAMMNTAA